MDNPYYGGPGNGSALGIGSGIISGLLSGYRGAEDDRMAAEKAAAENAWRMQQIEQSKAAEDARKAELVNIQQYRDWAQSRLAPINTPLFEPTTPIAPGLAEDNNMMGVATPVSSSNTLSPLGQQAQQGMMGGMQPYTPNPQGLAEDNSMMGLATPSQGAINPAYAPRMAEVMQQLQGQGSIQMPASPLSAEEVLNADLRFGKPDVATANFLKSQQERKTQSQALQQALLSSGKYTPDSVDAYFGGTGKLQLVEKQHEAKAFEDTQRYRTIRANMELGKPVAPEDAAFAKAYANEKTLSANVVAGARIQNFNNMPVSAYDVNTGNVGFVNREDIQGSPGRYVGAEMANKIKSKAATFDEIKTASKQVRDSLANIDYSQGQVAKFANVLGANDDGSSIRNFLGTNIAKTLTPDEVEYVTSVKNLKESAYALRSISGMGQGSDELRAAIAAVIPGARTPSKEYANKSLDRFDTQVDVLRSGVPGLGGVGSGAARQSSAASGGNIPQGAISDLQANPKLKIFFEQKYGKGAADQYLR